MQKPIIEVKSISKSYRLGTISLATFFDDLYLLGQKVGLLSKKNNNDKNFLALNDVSFSVNRGEIIGIIGTNGAGKSTLLKILSRITEPSSGTAVLRGRISSLLEVGTGFHGEMTGLENIYLNGSLHGLPKSEIDNKLQSIIEFSQIENFIKFYLHFVLKNKTNVNSKIYANLIFLLVRYCSVPLRFLKEFSLHY